MSVRLRRANQSSTDFPLGRHKVQSVEVFEGHSSSYSVHDQSFVPSVELDSLFTAVSRLKFYFFKVYETWISYLLIA